MSNSINAMNQVLGQNYQIIVPQKTDPIVLAKLPNENLDKNPTEEDKRDTISTSQSIEHTSEKTTDDYLFQIYLGSLTVVGLFILFRMIQKSK